MSIFTDPAILFFLFGVFAGLIRSNLEIPAQFSRFLSLYLLMSLGLKGGFALAETGFTPAVLQSLGCAIVLAIVVPLVSFALLRKLISEFDAAAIAATYGSVSAVTFITATQYMETSNIAFGAHMSAAMALMESPAIMLAVIFASMARAAKRKSDANGAPSSASVGGAASGLGKIVHESLTDGAQLLIVGAMVIGLLTGSKGQAAMQPFSGDLFKGMLAFFLLDMGLLTARSLPKLKGTSPWLLSYGVLAPLVHASMALALCWTFNIQAGNSALLMVLAASASYIAVPAVLRHAIPEANPSLYFGLSLGLTFPLNVLFGIPIYVAVAHAVLA
jgi:uncharacterized protein